jgi:hypothetical protein
VIGTFGPSTIQPVVTASRLPDQLKTAVRDMLLGLGRNAETEPALARGFIQGFVAIGDGDYDGIGAMLDASTPPATPPPSASKATRRWRSRAGPPDPRRGGRGLSITLTPQPCWLT